MRTYQRFIEQEGFPMRLSVLVEVLASHYEEAAVLLAEHGFEENRSFSHITFGTEVILYGECPYDAIEEIRDLEAVIAVTII